MNKEIENAYWAGYIDADGAIGISKYTNPEAKIGCSYVPYASVTNTNLKILQKLQQYFGGRIHKHKTKFFKNGKPLYIWYASSKTMKDILRSIGPYLKQKRRQADAISKYIHARSQHYKSYVPLEFWHDVAEPIYQQLKILNKRGANY